MKIAVKETRLEVYEFYIDSILMPVTPEAIKIMLPTKNETLDLANGKTYTVINSPGLATYEFGLLFPANEESAPFAVYPDGFKHPGLYLDFFIKLMEDKKPFQLVVINARDKSPKIINVTCVIKDYSVNLDAEKYGDDYYVDFKLERFEPLKTEEVKLVPTKEGVKVQKEKSNNKKATKKTHTVKKGETITTIVKNHYGHTKKLWDVVRKNKIKNGFLEVGQVIEFV